MAISDELQICVSKHEPKMNIGGGLVVGIYNGGCRFQFLSFTVNDLQLLLTVILASCLELLKMNEPFIYGI